MWLSVATFPWTVEDRENDLEEEFSSEFLLKKGRWWWISFYNWQVSPTRYRIIVSGMCISAWVSAEQARLREVYLEQIKRMGPNVSINSTSFCFLLNIQVQESGKQWCRSIGYLFPNILKLFLYILSLWKEWERERAAWFTMGILKLEVMQIPCL